MIRILYHIVKYYVKSKDSAFSLDISLPLLLVIPVALVTWNDVNQFNTSGYGVMISVCGILAAFSITSIVLLSSSDNETIRQAKTEKKGDKVVEKYKLTSFRKIYVTAAYSAVLSFSVLLVLSFLFLFPVRIEMSTVFAILHDSTITFLITHLILVNLSVCSKLYLLFFNESRIAGGSDLFPKENKRNKF